ncbi:MPHOSPH9 isoform 6 [Pongo abelii]|uniref:MPHOSPH9 isoform 6 n=1 Tax=Pongo abelii TaxID=9601 RepID=A0A2J8XJ62_PONAB|nr:MPHOSPH9 isoform 6 [Pongo abelii]
MEEFDLVKTLHKTSSSVESDKNSLHSLGLNLNTEREDQTICNSRYS